MTGLERLWERDDEIAALGRAIASAGDGIGSGVLLSGEAGIGKSALLAAARSLADADQLRVLSAQGAALEREYPFGVVLQLLGRLAADPEQRSVLLDGGGAAAAQVLAPETPIVRTPDAMFAALHGLFWAVSNLAARGPLLICVDDIQWSDEASLLFLGFLARRLEELPVALVVAIRAGEARDDAEPAVAELTSGTVLRVVEPAPLSAAGVLELARVRFGADVERPFADACHQRSGGNPFFATELLHALADQQVRPTTQAAQRLDGVAPSSISRVVLARLVHLGPDATALASAVAVLGDHTASVDAAQLAGLSVDSAMSAIAVLTGAGILADSDELRFAHPIMRDVLTADLAPAVLAARHAEAAQILDARNRSPELVAAHLLASPPSGNPRAVERLRAAARIALDRGASAEALTLLRRAMAEPPEPEGRFGVTFERGMAEAAAQRPEAIEHLRAALALAPSGPEHARVTLALGRLLTFSGLFRDVYPLVSEARAGLEETDRELLLALDELEMTAGCMDPAGPRLTPQRIAELSALTGATAGECAVLACLAFDLSRAAYPVGTVQALTERAIGGGAARMATAGLFTPLMLSVIEQWLGNQSLAAAICSDLIEDARTSGSLLLFSQASASRSKALARMGALDDAEADARQALSAEGALTGMPNPVALGGLITVLTDRGEFDAARQVAESAELPDDRDDTVLREILDTTLGRLDLMTGQNSQALSRLVAAGQIVEAAGTVNPASSPWRVYASSALVGLQRHAEAQEMLEPAIAAAQRSHGRYEVGVTLRASALAMQPHGIELLEESCAVLRPSESRLEYALSLVDLGAALRRAGHRKDARDPLGEGLELAHASGATLLRERARDELLATGSRPRRIERTGLDSLTPSERRVANLARDGLSNREVAQQLFVSTRTIESQLRSVYTKLGLSSRKELAGALGETTNLI